MSRALRQISCSFSEDIERTRVPLHFTQPAFVIYNGKTDLVEHVSHFSQLMALYSRNDGLMCKAFPFSLGPTAIMWFNGLKKGSIHNFEELIQAFGARFVTCSRVPQSINSILSMSMGEGETLRSYSDWYWELYNEIDRKYSEVVASTFKLGLPLNFELKGFLT